MMNETPYISILREIFHNPELIREITTSEPVYFPEKTIILREGAFVKQVPLVLRGSINVIREDINGKEILLYKIEAGESCALSISAILNDKESRAVAITETGVEAYLIPADKVKDWMFSYKGWYRFVLNLYNNRFNELVNTIDSIAFQQMDQRLVERLSRKFQGTFPYDVEITHQHLANELGTAREVVTRLLKKLERDHKVELSRGKIRVLKPL